MEQRPSRRTEIRTPLEVAVALASPDFVTYEVTTTRNVSPHGACVLTKHPWAVNQRVDLRSIQGTFRGLARVAHCRKWEANPGFAIGLEFFGVSGEWKVSQGSLGRTTPS